MSILQYRDDWNSDIYTIDGKSIKTLESVKINGKKYKVTARIMSFPYTDMGHSYTANSTHYFVTTKVFGTPLVVNLNTLVRTTEITPIEFTIEG